MCDKVHTARTSGDAPSSDDASGARWKLSFIDADRSCLIVELDTTFQLKQRDVVLKWFPREVSVYDDPAYLVPLLRFLTSAYIMRSYNHREGRLCVPC